MMHVIQIYACLFNTPISPCTCNRSLEIRCYSDKLELTQILLRQSEQKIAGWGLWFGEPLQCLYWPRPPWSQCKIDLKSQKPHSGVILLFSLIPQSSMIPRWLWLEIRYGPVCAYTITYKLICAGAHNKSMKCWQVAALHMDNLSFQQISGGKTNNYFEGFLNGSIFSFYPPLWACMPIVRVCLIKSCRDHLLLLPWLAH